jgi:hypothetical protein
MYPERMLSLHFEVPEFVLSNFQGEGGSLFVYSLLGVFFHQKLSFPEKKSVKQHFQESCLGMTSINALVQNSSISSALLFKLAFPLLFLKAEL